MKLSQILPTVATVLLLSATSVHASSATDNMEMCKVMKDGKNIVKIPDGGTSEAAWVWVPKGQCDKYNAGIWSGLTPEVKAKLDEAKLDM